MGQFPSKFLANLSWSIQSTSTFMTLFRSLTFSLSFSLSSNYLTNFNRSFVLAEREEERERERRKERVLRLPKETAVEAAPTHGHHHQV